MGVIPGMLTCWAAFRHCRDPEVRLWPAIAALVMVWALGPWWRVAGFDTGFLLPQNFLVHVPILSNARIPGRALCMVALAVRVTAAAALAQCQFRRRGPAVAAIATLIVADYLPAPFPLTAFHTPAFFARVRDTRDGSVLLELPVGVGDGLRSVGHFDTRALVDAMVHEHPIVGGYTGRLPAAIVQGYQQGPVLGALPTIRGAASSSSR